MDPLLESPPIENIKPEHPSEPKPSTAIANPVNDSQGGQWLHPYSLVFEVLSGGRQVVLPAAFAFWGAANGSGIGIAIAAGIFLLQIVAASLRYLTLRYRITTDELIVQKGLIFRSIRKVPLARIQNLDLVQNPLHRLLHVAEVKIETASGAEPEAVLRVLSLPQVDALRHGLFDAPHHEQRNAIGALQGASQELSPLPDPAMDGGASDAVNPTRDVAAIPRPISKEELVYSIPLRLLILAGLTSNQGFLLISVLVGALYEFNAIQGVQYKEVRSWGFTDWNLQRWVLVAMLVLPIAFILMRLLSAVWFVLRFHGYRIAAVGKDLRIRCGLITKIAATVPMDRIQVISIQSTWSMRQLGLATIRVETAGGGGKENESASEAVGRRWFIPVLRQRDLVPVLAQIHPGLEWDEKALPWQGLSQHAPARMLRWALLLEAALVVVGMVAWFPWGGMVALSALPLLIWRAYKKAKSMRYFRTATMAGFRSGTFTRKLSIAFLDKIQCVVWHQSPFDRRWNMANLSIDTAASGPADHKIHVTMLDAEFAEREVQSLELVLH